MATDVERLAVLIEAQTKSYENAMLRLETKTQKAIRASTKSLASLDKQMAMIGNRAKLLAGVLGLSLSVRGFQQLIDASTRVQNSLRVAGLAGDDLTKVYDQLFASAQRNATPIEALTTLFGRAAQVQGELGVSTDDLVKFTDKVAVALRVSGQSAEQSSGALLQLGQALGSGTVHAQEFNSILEGAPTIAQAAAAGIKEAGGSVAKLRQLVIDGKVSSSAFFEGFLSGARILDEKVKSSQDTVAQGFVKLQNSAINAAGAFDKVIGASLGASSGLGAIAGALDDLVADQDKLEKFVTLMERLVVAYAGARIGGAILGKKGALVGAFIGLVEPEIRKWAIDQGLLSGPSPFGPDATFKTTGGGSSSAALPAAGWTGTAILPSTFTPTPGTGVSLDKPPADPGNSAATIDRQRQAYEKLNASLSLQLANLTASDREQAIANDLAKLGTDATGEQRAAIAQLAGQLYDGKKAMEAFNETTQFVGSTIDDALEGLIIRGESANDVLKSMIANMAEMALKATLLGQGPLASLFGTASTASGAAGGIAGGIFTPNFGARA